MKNRKLVIVLFILACFRLAVPTLAAGTAAESMFTDIFPDGAGQVWYDYKSIQTCVEADIMKGSGNAFNPSGIFSVAETAVVAARLYTQTTGNPLPDPSAGEAWYEPAMSVMQKAGAIYYLGGDPSAAITRENFVHAIALGIPIGNFPVINDILVLSDTNDEIVLMFYNAGLLTGIDKDGTFNGAGHLTRAEAAAIIARIIDPSRRISFTPASTNDELLSLLLAKEMAAHPKIQISLEGNSNRLPEETLERVLALAGISANEVMLRIGGITITAEQLLPFVVFHLEELPDVDGIPAYDYPIPMQFKIDGVMYAWLEAVKRLALYDCVDYILLLLDGNLTPTAEDRANFLSDRVIEETEVLKNLDIKWFYKAIIGTEHTGNG